MHAIFIVSELWHLSGMAPGSSLNSTWCSATGFVLARERTLKASQGALRLTHSLVLHTAKQCDKVYVPSVCEFAVWKQSFFIPEQMAVKRKGSPVCEANPIQQHPTPFFALCQITDVDVTDHHQFFSFVLSKNEINTLNRFKSSPPPCCSDSFL